MRVKTGLWVMLVAFVLAGCTHMSSSEEFGKDTAYNMRVQVVNPDAPQLDHPEVKLDGQKAAWAISNYRRESPQADSTDLTTR